MDRETRRLSTLILDTFYHQDGTGLGERGGKLSQISPLLLSDWSGPNSILGLLLPGCCWVTEQCEETGRRLSSPLLSSPHRTNNLRSHHNNRTDQSSSVLFSAGGKSGKNLQSCPEFFPSGQKDLRTNWKYIITYMFPPAARNQAQIMFLLFSLIDFQTFILIKIFPTSSFYFPVLKEM